MIAGVLLAAGASRRYGTDKLLAVTVNGEAMAARCARRLAGAVDAGVAVIPPRAPRLRELCEQAGLTPVVNPHPERGMGSSLALGVAALPGAGGWAIHLADLPWVRADTVHAVVQALREGHALVVPGDHGRWGHPVGFGARFGNALAGLNGEQGARALLQAQRDRVTVLETDDPGIWRDVDTPDDVSQSKRSSSQGI